MIGLLSRKGHVLSLSSRLHPMLPGEGDSGPGGCLPQSSRAA